MKRRAALLALVAALGLPRPGVAQAPTASVPAEAVVVTVGMTVTTLGDLNFGTVTKGVATTVQPVDANAGAWEIVGNANAFVTIAFTLPAQLTNIQALPGSTMPITFSATSARWRRANNNPAGATPFDPAAGTVGRFGPPVNPTVYIWIGGTVTPALTAKPGIYRGNVIVSLTYL
ncbi:MAG TPA: DUF4402 domain-containing protein [Gemmatimonadales bacterium]|jgi:hypothetical protein|nr:DUF4402 domain-containing protein [Gemmatimonadales bacterium]